METNGFTDETLILISSDHEPPYTIIDGTHRACALLRMDAEGTRIHPWNAILVSSAGMRETQWDIQSPMAQQHMENCRAAAEARQIW